MDSPSTVIRQTNVLYGTDLRLHERTTLVLDEGAIREPGAGVAPGAETVDGSGLLLVPGFVDAHVHIGFADPADVLRGGVTTVRDLGWPEDEIFPLARRSRDPSFDGPLIVCTGPILTAPGGYPTRAAWAPSGTGHEIARPEEAAGVVARLAAAGASAIKIALNPPAGPVFDHETLRAVVSAAHGAGLKVTGHVYGTAELTKALECGVDELAHMLMSEEELSAEVVGRMVAAGMTIVPTLSVRFGTDRELAVDNLRRWRIAGGRVVYGTDLGNEGPRPGIDPLEVGAMAQAGYSTVEIVSAATAGAAAHLGLGSKGIVAEGMDADVVAVPLDALDDPLKLCDVKMVWREGRRVA